VEQIGYADQIYLSDTNYFLILPLSHASTRANIYSTKCILSSGNRTDLINQKHQGENMQELNFEEIEIVSGGLMPETSVGGDTDWG